MNAPLISPSGRRYRRPEWPAFAAAGPPRRAADRRL